MPKLKTAIINYLADHKPKPAEPEKSAVDIEAWVAESVLYRTEIDKAYEIIKQYEAEMAVINNRLLQYLADTKQKSARTAAGTVTAAVRETASLFDPDAFMNYVREHDAWELMERRAAKIACKDYAETNGVLPPGVKLNTIHYLSVRKANG